MHFPSLDISITLLCIVIVLDFYGDKSFGFSDLQVDAQSAGDLPDAPRSEPTTGSERNGCPAEGKSPDDQARQGSTSTAKPS